MSEDMERRLASLEEEDRRLREALSKLVINTEVMNNTLKILTHDISPRMESLENKVNDLQSKQAAINIVIDGGKWLAAIVGGSAITMALVYLFQTGGI